MVVVEVVVVLESEDSDLVSVSLIVDWLSFDSVLLSLGSCGSPFSPCPLLPSPSPAQIRPHPPPPPSGSGSPPPPPPPTPPKPLPLVAAARFVVVAPGR